MNIDLPAASGVATTPPRPVTSALLNDPTNPEPYGEQHLSATVQEVLEQINALEKSHSRHSKARKLNHQIEPFVQFVIRYTPIVDTIVQGNTNPSALIWGVLKAILEVDRVSFYPASERGVAQSLTVSRLPRP
jgi:hypothetical protein